ncbi:MAG: glycosyltransferase, partial [Candidatus Hodarchaeota archaeon]
MKILIIHNFYQSTSPSGEDLVFEAERILLKERSKRLDNKIKVITYEKKNDEINNLSVFRKTLLPFRTIWSQEAYKEIKSIIKKEKPDIAHFHNIWYLISPSGYYACKEFGVPVVQTLHNFRVFCVNGLLMRKGK